jgi:putative MATE family efflux protein
VKPTATHLKIDVWSLLRVALPISAGSMIQFVVVLTDNFFLSRLHQSAINGAGNAALIFLTLEMLAIGSAAAFQILIARRLGEGRRDLALQIFRTSVAFHMGLGLVLMGIAAALNATVLPGLIADPEVRAVFTPFLYIRLLGMFPLTILLAINAFYMGSARTWPILVVSGIMAGLNIVLDAAWVDGRWGFESWGPTGAAWASLTAEWVGCLVALGLAYKVIPDALTSRAFMLRDAFGRWWRLARPLMGQLLVTIATWTAFFFLVEKVGGLELKVSHIGRNLFMLAFVVAQGMGQTARTYVSSLLGAQRESDLRPALRRITALNLGGILLLCHGFVLYPQILASIFFEEQVGIEAMSLTLQVMFIAVNIYAFTGIALATLQGAGATVQAFRIELVAVVFYLIAVVWMTLIEPQPVWIIWRVEWLYFATMGLGSLWFLRKGDWRNALLNN